MLLAQMWLPLQPGEVVLSVVWQELGDVGADPGAVLGAVMTNQRVMMVTGLCMDTSSTMGCLSLLSVSVSLHLYLYLP